ncbi:MAG: glycosyltransferase, partial [Nanoarchaeota archaeon]|nr:glycosyltransferase [Nanoarchaeota archaeon]
MKIHYFTNKAFPNKSANNVQILKTVDGMNKIRGVETELVCFKSVEFKSVGNIYDRFSLSSRFKFNFLSSVDRGGFRNDLILFYYLFNNRMKINYIYSRSLIFSLLAKYLLRKRVIYEIHDMVKGRLYKLLLFFALKGFYKITVISNKIKEDIVMEYGSKNVVVIRDGASPEDFILKKSKKKLREELKLSQKKFIVTYIGSFQLCKGFDTFLDSIGDIKDEEVFLLLIGAKDKDLSFYNKKYKNYSNNFKLLANVEHKLVSSYLKASDVLIIPNSGNENLSVNHKIAKYYTSPLKLFEYMCSKRPIIGSAVPAIKEVLNENNSILVKPDSSKSIADAIILLKQNSLLRDKLAKKAYIDVKKFSWDNRGKKIVDLFK